MACDSDLAVAVRIIPGTLFVKHGVAPFVNGSFQLNSVNGGHVLQFAVNGSANPAALQVRIGSAANPGWSACRNLLPRKLAFNLSELECTMPIGLGENLVFSLWTAVAGPFRRISTGQQRFSYPRPSFTANTLRRESGAPSAQLTMLNSISSEELWLSGNNFVNTTAAAIVHFGPAHDPLLHVCRLTVRAVMRPSAI